MLENILACSVIAIGFGAAGRHEAKDKKNILVEWGIYILGVLVCLIFTGVIHI